MALTHLGSICLLISGGVLNYLLRLVSEPWRSLIPRRTVCIHRPWSTLLRHQMHFYPSCISLDVMQRSNLKRAAISGNCIVPHKQRSACEGVRHVGGGGYLKIIVEGAKTLIAVNERLIDFNPSYPYHTFMIAVYRLVVCCPVIIVRVQEHTVAYH